MPAIETHGATLFYCDQGSGDPVVMVHSSASSHLQWRGLMSDLGNGYRCLAPDLYGYGRSAYWPGGRSCVWRSRKTGCWRARSTWRSSSGRTSTGCG